MLYRLLLLSFIFYGYTIPVWGQQIPLQKVKGIILERSIKTPISGATIELPGIISRATISDSAGYFRFDKIPVGRHALRISCVGYKTVTQNNLLVESGKELILTIEMEEEITTGSEVVISGKANKARPLNQFSMVSSRMFSVEETRRFAAGLNDPSRIATAFAGVASNGDGNSLVIRGNAPNGLLWRMEGVDIPNPNHFTRVGTSGGAISILSAQVLANSDFMTGAFPAEYGNALSGVFDIKLRKGNKEKREHTFSASTLGIDAATEGYFKKGYGGSYLVNYRYGFLTLIQKLGINIGDAPTAFQDLSFNVFLPTKKLGDISIFGFGGLSKQQSIAVNDSVLWLSDPDKKKGQLDASNTGAIGVAHTILFSKKTQLKTIISLNAFNLREEDNRYEKVNGPLVVNRNNQFQEQNIVVSSVATHKFNSHHLLKAGLYTSGKGFDLLQQEAVTNILRNKVKMEGNTRLTNLFTQWKWDPVRRLSLQAGIHAQYFSLNHTSFAEPRMGVRYATAPGQYLSLGYGLHSQIQPLGNYFARIRVGNDTVMPNKDLGFSRARHYVLGYAIQLAPNWNLKTEVYYQSLFNIPVTAGRQTSYSIINQDDDYAIEPLANDGKGTNYGLELTLERWWNDQFYLLSTISLYQSKYLPSDNLWRNTRYNSNTAWTFLAGKEWALKGRRSSSVSLDLKMVQNGGIRVTPIDLIKSKLLKRTVLDVNRIYEEKLKAFFRIDLQAEWKLQYMKMTSSVIIGVQNLTNRKNIQSQSYDSNTGKIIYSYQLGIIPVVGYKVDL